MTERKGYFPDKRFFARFSLRHMDFKNITQIAMSCLSNQRSNHTCLLPNLERLTVGARGSPCCSPRRPGFGSRRGLARLLPTAPLPLSPLLPSSVSSAHALHRLPWLGSNRFSEVHQVHHCTQSSLPSWFCQNSSHPSVLLPPGSLPISLKQAAHLSSLRSYVSLCVLHGACHRQVLF